MNIEDDIKIINDGVTELSHYIAGAPHDAHYNYRLATLQWVKVFFFVVHCLSIKC